MQTFPKHASNTPLSHDSVAVALLRWQEQAGQATTGSDLPERAMAMAGSEELRNLFAHSPYLTDMAIREMALTVTLLESPDRDRAAREAVRAAIETLSSPEETREALMAQLRQAKRRVALTSALADILDVWSLESVTGCLSFLADRALHLSVSHLLLQAARAGDIELNAVDDPCLASGLIILGMGKLGSLELNFSSDIDIIVLYDTDVVQTKRPDRLERTFVRLARDLVTLMEHRTADGYVFRTDLRLRPDPGATPLAVAVTTAETYYGAVGQNWERAAMIKARPAAGDILAGARFLEAIQPFIWRRHLDFAAIGDIHAVKRQINAHRGHRVVRVAGHDLKVGRGGIREIEFFVQTQQLIYGGRDTSLRCQSTLDGLLALTAAGHVNQDTASELACAYLFLRRLEHRIQMIDDQQTHRIPEEDADVARLASFFGSLNTETFRSEVTGWLERVAEHYAALFEDTQGAYPSGNLVFTGHDDDPGTLVTLSDMGFTDPSNISAIIRGWHHGRYRATRSERAREILTLMIPTLLERLGLTPAPDEAFANFDRFLSGLHAGVQVLSLLHQHPELLGTLTDILGTIPLMAAALGRRPALLDLMLGSTIFGPLPNQQELAADLDRVLRDTATLGGFEQSLDQLRVWTTERKFQVVARALARRNVQESDTEGNTWEAGRGLNPEEFGPFLSDVADVALIWLLEAVQHTFAHRHGHLRGGACALVALGKLGERRMAIGSDLDLIVLYHVDDPDSLSDGDKPLHSSDYYIRLTQRLIAAISALTAEGRLYEVDLRLRPSGSKGPLAVSTQSFRAYHEASAWTWERQALTRARVIAGPQNLTQDIQKIIQDILIQPHDLKNIRKDILDMLQRIKNNHSSNNILGVKYLNGGMIDIEFVAQYLALINANRYPDILKGETAAILEEAARVGFAPAPAIKRLVTALDFWRRVQMVDRLTGDGSREHNDEGQELRAISRLLARDGLGLGQPVSVEKALALIGQTASEAATACYEIFDDLSLIPLYPQAEDRIATDGEY